MDPYHRTHARFALSVALALASTVGAAHSAVRFHAPVLSQLGRGVPFANGGQRLHLSHGDLNGDGRLDVVAPLLDSLAIYLGHGDGSFDVPLRIAIPTRTDRTAVGDFDHDGALDIAFGGFQSGRHDNPVVVLYGDGTGLHWTPVTLSNADDYVTVLAGDYDGDGRTDLASLAIDPSNVNWLRTYLSRPGRTFEAHAVVQPTANPLARALRTCDANEDGRADIATLTVSGDPAGVWISHGDGTFQRTASLSMGATDFSVGDFDGDGHVDLIAFDDSDWLSTALGHGDGTFGAVRWFCCGSGATGAVGDLDGDGRLDVAFARKSDPEVWTRLGTGDGNFASPRASGTGDALNPLDLVDLDGDEKLDFIGLSGDGLVAALGDGDGGFRRMAPVVPFGAVTGLAVGDFDRDGIADVVGVDGTAPTRLRVALGRPGRAFVLPAPLTVSGLTGAIATGDFDSDGFVDVIAASNSGQAVFCRGRGDGGVDSAGVFNATGLWSPAVRDVNGDGHLDLMYATTGALHVLVGDGAGGFGASIDSQLLPYVPTSVALGDLNDDGRTDAIVCLSNFGPLDAFVYKCLGDGAGHFTASVLASYPGLAGWIGAGVTDADEDGRDDVLGVLGCSSCTWTGSAWVRLQQPGGTLAPPVASLASTGTSVRFADVDDDQHVDLLTFGASGPVLEFGDGAGRFGRSEGYGGTGRAPLALADFDGDGRPDLLANTLTTTFNAIIYYGREFTPPTVALFSPEGGATYGAGSHVPVTWQAEDDDAMGMVDVFVSRHGRGGPFVRVGTDQPASGTIAWPVSGGPTDSLAFKIVARDAADNVAWVTSDSLAHVSNVVGVDGPPRLPDLAIRSVRPNPAGSEFQVTCAVPTESECTLTLHDVSGRLIACLARGIWPPGLTSIHARMPVDAARPSVYFLRLSTRAGTRVARFACVH